MVDNAIWYGGLDTRAMKLDKLTVAIGNARKHLADAMASNDVTVSSAFLIAAHGYLNESKRLQIELEVCSPDYR